MASAQGNAVVADSLQVYKWQALPSPGIGLCCSAMSRSADGHAGELALADLQDDRLPRGDLDGLVRDLLAVDADAALLDHAQRLGGARREAGGLQDLGDRHRLGARGDGHLGHVLGERTLAEPGLEVGLRSIGVAGAVEAGHDLAREAHLDVAGIESRLNVALPAL